MKKKILNGKDHTLPNICIVKDKSPKKNPTIAPVIHSITDATSKQLLYHRYLNKTYIKYAKLNTANGAKLNKYTSG